MTGSAYLTFSPQQRWEGKLSRLSNKESQGLSTHPCLSLESVKNGASGRIKISPYGLGVLESPQDWDISFVILLRQVVVTPLSANINTLKSKFMASQIIKDK